MKFIDKKINRYIEEIKSEIKNNKESEILEGIEAIEEKIKEIEPKIEEKNRENSIKELIDKFNLEKRIYESREDKIIKSLIKILDSIEWVFENNEEKFQKTTNNTRKLIDRELENIKLKTIGKKGDLYNENYHNCLGYEDKREFEEDEIIEVIKKGYMFKDKIIRQSEVIVEKKEKNDEYNWDRFGDYYI